MKANTSIQMNDVGEPVTVFIHQSLSFYRLNGTRYFFQIRNIDNECDQYHGYKLLGGYTPPKRAWPSIIQKVVQKHDIEFSKGDNKLAGAILFDHVDGANPAV